MKWKTKPKPQSKDVRMKSGFLIFPKKIGCEWRWLEFARWTQRVEQVRYGGPKEWVTALWENY